MKEALKLALEALTIADNIALVGAAYTPRSIDLGLQKISSAITAIKEALAQPERDYERGFIDGMQKQMQSSVDKTVNAMSQRTWVGLTIQEANELWESTDSDWELMKRTEAKLKEKNT